MPRSDVVLAARCAHPAILGARWRLSRGLSGNQDRRQHFFHSLLLRIGSAVRTVPIITGFAVDPDHRRAAVPLVERIRRLHAEREIAFGIGGFGGSRSSASYSFWTRYSRAFPQKYHFCSRPATGSILAPGGMARASITWERLASNTLGHLLSLTQRHDPHVRQGRVTDLQRCAQMLESSSADFDWAMVCSAEQLARRWTIPHSGPSFSNGKDLYSGEWCATAAS